MKRVLCLLFSAVLYAQPNLSLLTGVSAPSGQASTVIITLVGSANTNLAALQWTVSSTVPFSMSVGSGVGAKVMTCNGADVSLTRPCVLTGIDTTLLVDGPMAVITYTISPAQFTLTATLGASLAGNTVVVGASQLPPPIAACDLNKDGKVDSSDVLIGITAVITGTPSLSDISGDGVWNVVDVQRVINAALPGGVCRVGI